MADYRQIGLGRETQPPNSDTAEIQARASVFVGNSKMSALMRDFDWAATSLGSVAQWPQPLRFTVTTCLSSHFPLLIWWDQALIMLYNDAYQQIIGDKHPAALGQPGRETWPEIWPTIGPMLQSVLDTGHATWSEDHILLLQRHGYQEECYFTFSYSPIRDEMEKIVGVFTAVQETSDKVISQRRLRTISTLAKNQTGRSIEESCSLTAEALATNPYDIPFALLYRMRASKTMQARLTGMAGIVSDTAISPDTITISDLDPSPAIWPLSQVAQTGESMLVEKLEQKFNPLPRGAWSIPPRSAIVVPVILPGQSLASVFLISAINPHKTLDEDYLAFFDLVVKQIATNLTTQALYASEERYRAFITHSAEGIWRYELDQPMPLDLPEDEQIDHFYRHAYLAECNEAMAHMYGFSRAQELIGSPLPDLLVRSDPRNVEYLRTFIRAGYRLNDAESCEIDRFGHQRYFLNNLTGIIEDGFVVRAWGTQFDVTARKQTEEEVLRLSEALRTSIDTIALLDLEGNFIEINQAGLDLLGVEDSKDLIGQSALQFFLPEDHERVMNGKEIVLETGHFTTEAFSLLSRHENTIPIELSASLVRDAAGRQLGVAVILRSITERKQAEEDLRKWKTLYDSASQASGQILYEWSIQTDEVTWNGAVEKVLGYSPSETPGNLDGWLALVHPDDQDQPRQWIRRMQTGTDPPHLEYRVQRKDGEYIWLEIKESQIWQDTENPSRAVGFVSDITQRKRIEIALRQSEERVRLATEKAQIGLWDYDLLTGVITWSEQVERLAGLAPGTFGGTSEHAFSFIHPEDREYIKTAVKYAIAEGTDYEVEFRGIRSDETVAWVMSRGKVLYDQTRKPIRMTGVVLDITARKRSEEELRRLTQELKRSNDDLTQFAYVASHDLQEPLRKIGSFTTIFAKRYHGQLDAEANALIDVIVSGTTRMQRLIHDLLIYARVDSKGKPYSPASSEAVVRQTLEMLHLAITESGAQVTYDPLPVVWGEASQLEQLFQNLIGNAIKFRGTMPPQIHISARRAGQYWLFTVRDNGIGLDPSHGERIFALFQRLHGRTEYAGTGIGLAICKKIVERHGGRIWVESEPGHGATFFFTITDQWI